MTSRERVLALLAGLAAGLAGGLFGVGGGIAMIPILTGALSLTQHQAHGTSLAAMAATAIAGATIYALHGNVAWIPAAVLAMASMLTARYGARWAARTPSGTLRRVFAGFLVLVALRLLWRVPEVVGEAPIHGLAGVALGLLLGAAVGVLSGYMGVGGGILAVPALTLGLGMTQQAAQGTSLAVIAVTGPAGAIEHARHGNVVTKLIPALAVGALLGAPVASWVAQLVPHAALARAFAIFLLATAVRLWFQAGKIRAEASGP